MYGRNSGYSSSATPSAGGYSSSSQGAGGYSSSASPAPGGYSSSIGGGQPVSGYSSTGTQTGGYYTPPTQQVSYATQSRYALFGGRNAYYAPPAYDPIIEENICCSIL